MITTFKSCLDILRIEGLTGDRALRNLTYLLVLKQLEKHFNDGTIDIDNYEINYDLYLYNPENAKQLLLYIARFSNLYKKSKTD